MKFHENSFGDSRVGVCEQTESERKINLFLTSYLANAESLYRGMWPYVEQRAPYVCSIYRYTNTNFTKCIAGILDQVQLA
jgi:hypothetical protein